jgi:hypothetical protein
VLWTVKPPIRQPVALDASRAVRALETTNQLQQSDLRRETFFSLTALTMEWQLDACSAYGETTLAEEFLTCRSVSGPTKPYPLVGLACPNLPGCRIPGNYDPGG